VHVAVLDEVESNIDVVFFQRYFEHALVQFESIIRLIIGKALIASCISNQTLNFRRDAHEITCDLKDYLKNVLVVVANAKVNIK
jgi:hypothetical protein